MKLVQFSSEHDEPTWDCFTTSGTDFRPHWNGDLVNVFTTIYPQGGADETKQFVIACARKLAQWVLENRSRFGRCDRFQIIVGWHKEIRPTGRQIIKAGGDYAALEAIVSGSLAIETRGNWTAAVFDKAEGEQEAAE